MPDATAIFRQKELIERYKALPADVKQAFFDVDIAEKIMAIGKDAKLNVEQTGELANATGLFLLGVAGPAEFVSRLERSVRVNREAAKAIVNALNKDLFLPIRESLKKIHSERWADDLAAHAERVSAAGPPPPSPAEPKVIPQRAKEVPPSPAAEMPKAHAPPTAPALKKPEPLIIKPLSPAGGPSPAPILPAAPSAPRPVPPAPKAPETLVRPQAAQPAPGAHPGLPKPPPPQPQAPVISPLGVRQTLEKSEIGGTVVASKPMPPEAAYERAREAVQKELAGIQQVPPAETKPPPPKPPTPPSPYVITKEELRTEIEKFRKPEDRIQISALPSPPLVARSAVPPPSLPVGPSDAKLSSPPPLKLPREKISPPAAPERYGVDPYKEPVE